MENPRIIDFDVLFARLIREMQRRITSGEITQKGLADAMGVTIGHINNLVLGRRALSPEVANKMLRALSISVKDLIAIKDR